MLDNCPAGTDREKQLIKNPESDVDIIDCMTSSCPGVIVLAQFTQPFSSI